MSKKRIGEILEASASICYHIEAKINCQIEIGMLCKPISAEQYVAFMLCAFCEEIASKKITPDGIDSVLVMLRASRYQFRCTLTGAFDQKSIDNAFKAVFENAYPGAWESTSIDAVEMEIVPDHSNGEAAEVKVRYAN
jgi:hypothetical protein